LRDEGIVPAFSLDDGVTTSLYPDGNFVELQVDNFCDWNIANSKERSSPLSIAIIGVGQIGSACAYQLASADHDVTVVARRESHRFQQLRETGAGYDKWESIDERLAPLP